MMPGADKCEIMLTEQTLAVRRTALEVKRGFTTVTCKDQ